LWTWSRVAGRHCGGWFPWRWLCAPACCSPSLVPRRHSTARARLRCDGCSGRPLGSVTPAWSWTGWPGCSYFWCSPWPCPRCSSSRPGRGSRRRCGPCRPRCAFFWAHAPRCCWPATCSSWSLPGSWSPERSTGSPSLAGTVATATATSPRRWPQWGLARSAGPRSCSARCCWRPTAGRPAWTISGPAPTGLPARRDTPSWSSPSP